MCVCCATLFLHFAPTWTHNAPLNAKKRKKHRHSSWYNHSHPSRSQPLTRNSYLTSMCTWCCSRIPGDCTGLPCRSLGSGVIKIGSDCGSVSISHSRLTQNVYIWCLDVNTLLMGASPNQRHRWDFLAATTSISIFWVLYFGVMLGHNWGV